MTRNEMDWFRRIPGNYVSLNRRYRIAKGKHGGWTLYFWDEYYNKWVVYHTGFGTLKMAKAYAEEDYRYHTSTPRRRSNEDYY